MSRKRSRLGIVSTFGLVLMLSLAACDRSSDTDQQIADLEQQVSDLQGQLDQTQAELDDAQGVNADLQQQLTDTQAQLAKTQENLKSTQEELGATEAALLDAQTQLARVGEVRLQDGTYVGPVLGAKNTPYRLIVFNAGGLFRVAEVASDVTITSGGSDLTLSQFAKLLSSTKPEDAKLANGNYRVIVKKGLVTSIRKSKA